MLSPDVSATENAVTSYVNSRTPIVDYAVAVIEIPLGSQPLVIDGQDAGSYDPLNGFPALADSLQTAKDHVTDFANKVDQPIHMWAIVTIPAFNDQFQTETGAILKVINQLGSTGVPTSAQRQAVTGALQNLKTQLSDGRSKLVAIQDALNIFLDQLSSDYQILVNGSNSISASITELNKALLKDELKASGGIFGGDIANLIGKIGGKMIDSLQSVLNAINKAATSNKDIGTAMSDLANTVATLLSKYDSVLNNVQNAKDEQFASILQELDIQLAQTDWKQLADFISESGL